MPWGPDSASSFTKKARTAKQKRQFAHVANNVLKRTGSEKRAIKAANAVVGRSYKRNQRRSGRK